MDYRTDKFRVEGASLVVHFTGSVGTATRHCTVRVPLQDMALSASFRDGLDRAARRALVEYWSGVEIPDEPMF